MGVIIGNKMASKKSHRRPMAEINVVPYIDVMLVLLVIFMITTPFLSQGVKVNLPKAQAKPLATKQSQTIILSVDAQGNYYLNIADTPSKPIPIITLQNLVSRTLSTANQKGETRQVFVKGDKNVDYGKVMQAMVILQQAGAQSVGLMTETPEK